MHGIRPEATDLCDVSDPLGAACKRIREAIHHDFTALQDDARHWEPAPCPPAPTTKKWSTR